MEFHWLRRGQNDRLVLFVLGWAADYRVVEHIGLPGCDVLAVYDYGGGLDGGLDDGLAEKIAGYGDVRLLAWSFGVWVAERLLAGVELTRAVALNGTPVPVDALYGIEPRRMAVTLRGLKAGGMEAFDRRAYGEHFDKLRPVLSPRPQERNIAELEYLVEASAAGHAASLRWDKAIVGSEDLIFPPENMVRYWGSRAEILPLPHYPFADGGLIEKEIGCR